MNKVRLAFCAVLFVFLALALASQSQALPNRTYVSGVGDDANPCARTAPCRTFAGAISKTEAGGEINALDAGGFGVLTITKSITVDGTGVLAGVAVVSGNGFTISNAGLANTLKIVRLRGLSINGYGTGQNGINVQSNSRVVIEDCVIDGFALAGINCAAGSVFVKNTTISNNKFGVTVTAGQVALNDVSVHYNTTGLVSDPGLIVIYNNVVLWGNTNGDPPPPRNR
ncbi:MAG TPA: hypothetical protein VJT71_20640 [Pyrinomonadaceae bacterium]|nr:hypothetical protein [Pyrinomonadaceae bacterium]